MKILVVLFALLMHSSVSAKELTVLIIENWKSKPMAGCQVTLKSNVGRVLEEAVTDSLGVVTFSKASYGYHTVEAKESKGNFHGSSTTFKLKKDTAIIMVLSPTRKYARTQIALEDSIWKEQKTTGSNTDIKIGNNGLPNRSDAQMKIIDDHIKRHVNESFRYPEISRELGDQGIVYVQFILESDASVTEITVSRGLSQELDREARRLIRSIPPFDFIPETARFNRMRLRYPIIFTLQ